MEDMPDTIEGFDHVEYLMIFVAIIFGYVGAEYFIGWGAMIRNRKQIRFYWPHVLWTVFAFTLFMQNWYGIWPRTKYINESFFYFFYTLFPILIFHIISVLLFPAFRSDKTYDMKRFFFGNTRWLYSIFAIYFLLTITSSFVYKDAGNVLMQNAIRGLGMLLSLLAAWFHKTAWLHKAFLIIAYGALFAFIMAIPR